MTGFELDRCTTLRSEPDGRLWFFTARDSSLVDELRADPRVCLAYGDNGSATYVSVSGRAAMSEDPAMTEELWNPALKAWFADKDDPNLQLLEITVEDAEYWDGPRNRFVRLAGILAAAVTRQEYRAGDQGELTLEPGTGRSDVRSD
jgi:general stress protein 26